MDKLTQAFAKHNMILEGFIYEPSYTNQYYNLTLRINCNESTKLFETLNLLEYIGKHTYYIDNQYETNKYIYLIHMNSNFVEKLTTYLLNEYNFSIQNKITKKFKL
jgi:hypothetical protein